jgi:hypothetical protein
MEPIPFEELTHIATETVQEDLDITKVELKDIEDELEILKRNPSQNKLKIYFGEGNKDKRVKLILRLEEILKYRENAKTA